MAKYRVYADTSVIGGCLDDEFAAESSRFIELVRNRRVTLLISQVVVDELAEAPEDVRAIVPALPPGAVEIVSLTPEILALRDAYLQARIVGAKWTDDATHVAAATLSGASAIVSWNFRHMVRLDRIRLYNEVNQRHGHPPLLIVTPLEVTREFDGQE